MLYVHVLHFDDVESVRRDILRLTDLAVRALGSPEAVAAQDELGRDADREAAAMITAALRRAVAGRRALFAYRLLRGPSLADRVVGVDGIIVDRHEPDHRQRHGHRRAAPSCPLPSCWPSCRSSARR